MTRNLWTSAIAAILLVGLSGVGHADTSAAALYNLGNSYARQGKAALAVVNYERARILAPRDPDIRANLLRVEESAGLTPAPRSWSDRLLWFSPDTSYWIGFTGLLVAGAGWLLLCSRQPFRIASGAALGSGLLLVAFSSQDAVAVQRLAHESVVLQPASASAAPISGAEAIFGVPPATVVQRQEDHGAFSLIRVPGGRTGWVARSDLMPIIQ